MNKGEIIIYQTPEGNTQLEVKLEDETVWLTQSQMVELFGRDRTVITKHIKNIFKEGELEEKSNVHFLHIANSDKPVKMYNLDVIISVGYRVKSQRGTQFRIWANKTLKKYLVKGYVINQKAKSDQLQQALDAIKVLTDIAVRQNFLNDESKGILRVIKDYTYGLDILDQYDHQRLTIELTDTKEQFRATYKEAINAIGVLRDRFGSGGLFGNEKDESFKSSINTIYQTFDGIELYPSVEEKAGMLLYLVTKNHSFSDGNKRIAAFLFIWFMEKNGILYNSDGIKRIENNALVALTLMIAESRSDEKDIIIKVIVNLINSRN